MFTKLQLFASENKSHEFNPREKVSKTEYRGGDTRWRYDVAPKQSKSRTARAPIQYYQEQ